MPLVDQYVENDHSWGLWKIEEEIDFFESSISYRSSASHPEKIKQQMAARKMLKDIYPDFPFENVELGIAGKPFLPHSELDFSISHCNGFAAAMVSKSQKVGIDIEIIHEKVLKIEKKFLSTNELFQLSALDPMLRITYTTLFWSLKEAFFKWWGKGGLEFSSDMIVSHFDLNVRGKANMKFSKIPEAEFEMEFSRHHNLWVARIAK